MAQNIDLLGAQYSDVPAVTLPKVGGGTASFTDVTGTTAIAGDVAQGKYFFTANGTLTLGTNQGGGGYVTQDENGYIVLPSTGGGGGGGSGLEYETGTWTPSEDTINPTINFTDTHTNPPISIIFHDATGTEDATTNTNYEFAWADYSQVGNVGMVISSTKTEYARAMYAAKTSSTSLTCWIYDITHPYSDTSSGSSTYYRYWVTNTYFKPSAISTSRYWIAGRTYKWIAVWAPTT